MSRINLKVLTDQLNLKWKVQRAASDARRCTVAGMHSQPGKKKFIFKVKTGIQSMHEQ